MKWVYRDKIMFLKQLQLGCEKRKEGKKLSKDRGDRGSRRWDDMEIKGRFIWAG